MQREKRKLDMHEIMLGGCPRPRDFRLTQERQERLKKGDIVANILDLDPVDECPKEGSTAFRITSPERWCKSVLVTYYSSLGWVTSDELAEARQKDPRLAP